MKEMTKIEHDLLTKRHTEVYHDTPEFNAPHQYVVIPSEDPIKILCEVDFQKGPIKEHGVNGVNNEDLIAMVVSRLEHFNQSEFSCRENAMAITKLEEALLWLRKRTMGREQRGVEGINQK